MSRKHKKRNKSLFMSVAFLAFMVYPALSLKHRFAGGRADLWSDHIQFIFNGRFVKVAIGIVILFAGYIIIAWLIKSTKKRNRKLKLRDSGIFQIDRMTGTEFEEYLTVFFENLGYRVEDIGGKGDMGADRLLTDSKSGQRICVQAKCWAKNVTFEAVQQVFTAKTLYHCQEAWIITNRGFTKQVRQTADKLGIDLWDRERLIDNMYAYRKNMKTKAKANEHVYLALSESQVFHNLSCEHGRSLRDHPDSVKYNSYNDAVRSGKRKCKCYK